MATDKNKLYWDIDLLHEWDKNPRSISSEDFTRLKDQIKKLGEYKPLIITPTGTVLGGNMRLKAYRELGFKKVWVSIVHAETEAEKVRYALSDNDSAGTYIALLSTDDLNSYKVNMGEPIDLGELLKELEDKSEDDSMKYKSQFQVVVECESESEQQEAYEKLQELGYNCKVLSI